MCDRFGCQTKIKTNVVKVSQGGSWTQASIRRRKDMSKSKSDVLASSLPVSVKVETNSITAGRIQVSPPPNIVPIQTALTN